MLFKRAVVTAYPAVLLRSAVSFSSRSVGCRSFWGFLEGICLCSESNCIVNEKETAQSAALCQFFFWHPQQLHLHVTILRISRPDLRSNDGSSPRSNTVFVSAPFGPERRPPWAMGHTGTV